MKTCVTIIICLIGIFAQGQISDSEKDLSAIYGRSCGRAGIDPDLRVELENLVRNEDVATLILWLDNDLLSKRIYATEGLIRLHNSGIQLTQEQINRIKNIKQLDVKIWTCSGCEYWRDSVKSLLKDYTIK